MFSGRVPDDLTPNLLTRAAEALRDRGVPLVDLTESNPTTVGLRYPPELLAPLSRPSGLAYDPHPFGLPDARAAVSEEFQRRALPVGPDEIILTASTSEAYSLLFKLLCDPGDEVLVPQPSYPLFDHLSRLDAVLARPYRLEFHGRWTIDVGAVARAVSPRTRAILVVSPNNPTGSVLDRGTLAELDELCAARALTLIGDEVFADYPLPSDAALPSSVLEDPTALAFALGGLSKSAGLPQLKLGWIAAAGPSQLTGPALARLELISDTYLSVATPVQLAARSLIRAGREIRAAILQRIRWNYRQLESLVAEHPSCTLLPGDGGWSAVIRVPATRPEETLALELLEEDHVLVHPGYFFDFDRGTFVIVSLLPPPEEFREGMTRVLARASA